VNVESEVLKTVVTRLTAAGISYMVSGSTALNYYAQPRMTRDVDIVVELGPQDAERLAALFQEDFYCDLESVRNAIMRRGLVNIVHFEHVVKIDFIVRKDSPYRLEEFSRKRLIHTPDFSLWVVAPEDLLLSKLYWAKDSHSEIQLRDVRNLVSAVEDLDWSYIERWAEELSVAGLLQEVRR